MSLETTLNASPLGMADANGHANGAPFDRVHFVGRLQDAFLISQCLMLVTSSVVFAAAEGGPIPAVTGAMAPFALYLVDRQRWFSLPNFWAGVLGVSGLAAAFIEFASGDIESRLLSGGHFMCYLTWIVLWQRKSWRQYWMLSGFSILQVAVGSLLTNSYWLGCGLLAYMVVAMWTLCVFTMYRMEAVAAESHARRLRTSLSPPWFPVTATPVSLPLPALSEGVSGISVRFVGISLAVIAASLTFASVAFVLIPRVWVGQFQIFDNSPLPGTRSLTGFTREVRLGELGEVLESSDPVMDIEFFDNQSGRKLPLDEVYQTLGTSEPLFRGAVLESYENGRWRAGRSESGEPSRRPSSRDFLRQEISLYPIGSETLFATGSPVASIARQPREIVLEYSDRTFSRTNNANLNKGLRYFALSRVADSVSAIPPLASWGPSGRPATLIVPDDLQALEERTRALLYGTEGRRNERAIAKHLESWLRDSGEFTYTLNLSLSDPHVDPIHDFFFNRKAGHCEYFAATLTMMLRSVDIHARIVSGFKGGAADASTDVLQVKQLHAHAWVEAWIDEQWLQLDPTPVGRLAVVESIEAGGSWRRGLKKLQSIWNDGLTWSKADQDELIYNPMQRTLAATWENLQSPAAGLQRATKSFRSFLSDPSRWFSWQGGMLFTVIALFAVAVWKFIRFLVDLIGRQRELAAARAAAGISVPFYARFESLLQSLKLIRQPSQTPQEFASQVRRRFETMPNAATWPTDFPARITDSYYSVRFGDREIDDSLSRAIEQDLDALEQQIRGAESNERAAK
jgi:transglutaminase-like putative cysteine protease